MNPKEELYGIKGWLLLPVIGLPLSFLLLSLKARSKKCIYNFVEQCIFVYYKCHKESVS